jgi:RNA 2',3'-cyclic 3'-phosphodiesterase
MRTFVAVDLEPEIRERIHAFANQVKPLAREARWVSRESLHLTLKFIGEKPDAMVQPIAAALASVASDPFQIRFSGTGFFPTPRAARVFWMAIESDKTLSTLANAVDESLSQLGIAKEARAFSPHLTLARARGESGAPGWRRGDTVNRQFAKLQAFLEKHPAPDFGTMTTREFFLYRSQLSSRGSQYTKLARFELKPASQ